MEQIAPVVPPVRKVTPVGIVGLVIALLALASAALSPWALDALSPQKPIDEVAVDVAVRIKDRLAAKAQGQEYVAPAGPGSVNWSKWYSGIVVGAGVLAICIGVFGLIAHHHDRLNAATIGVGASAIVFQYMVLIAGALLLVLLVGLVLSALADGT